MLKSGQRNTIDSLPASGAMMRRELRLTVCAASLIKSRLQEVANAPCALMILVMFLKANTLQRRRFWDNINVHREKGCQVRSVAPVAGLCPAAGAV